MYTIGDKFHSVAIDYKDRCALVHNRYVCENRGFVMRHIVSEGCEFQVTHDVTLTKCTFRPVPNAYMVMPLETTSAIFCRSCRLMEMCQKGSTSILIEGSQLFDGGTQNNIYRVSYLQQEDKRIYNSSANIFLQHIHNQQGVVEFPAVVEFTALAPLKTLRRYGLYRTVTS